MSAGEVRISMPGLHSAPAAGFDEPFEMLEACHERVQRMLALIQRIREHLAAHGNDEQAQQAARDVMRYFDVAAPLHHEDEELHVFPPLLAAGVQLEAVRQLQRDHVQMAAAWPVARAVLQAVSDGRLQRLQSPDEQALEHFSGLYGAHIECENQIVYPAAAAQLDAPAQAAMGQEMARRRGL